MAKVIELNRHSEMTPDQLLQFFRREVDRGGVKTMIIIGADPDGNFYSYSSSDVNCEMAVWYAEKLKIWALWGEK